MRRRPDGAAEQRGAISPLIIGFALILGLLVTVVVAASRVFLFQRELSAMADGAALSAADGIDTSAIYAGNGVVRLDPVAATDLARSYLSASGARGKFPGLASSVAVVAPTRVQVQLSARCSIPLVSSVISEATMPVSATAEAQSQRR